MKPTLAAIAQKAGLAKSTVSLALRNDARVNKATRIRVQKVAQEMGYHSNPVVARLMNELRKSQDVKYQATVAMVKVSIHPLHVQNLATKELIGGFIERANSQGYQVDHFWLHEIVGDVRHNAEHIRKVLQSRNIKGIAFHDLRCNDDLIDCGALWNNYPCVVLGPRLTQPPLNFVTGNHYTMAMDAIENILKAGYQCVGIVMDKWIDEIFQHRMTAAYNVHKSRYDNWPPVLYLPVEPENNRVAGKKLFKEWIERYRPDACFCINRFILDWILEMGIKLPEEMGLAFSDLNKETSKIAAGMNQQRTSIGMTAADILIGKITRGETSVPPYQAGTTVMSYWVPGPTIKS